MRVRAMLLPLLAGVLLGACAAGGASRRPSDRSPTPAASAAPSVAGGPMVADRTFISSAITGRDLVPGTRVTLRFKDGQLGASAGCNSMSGDYQIVGGALSVGRLATTEMGCEADLMAQDQWLAAFLPGAAISLDGTTLSLAKDGVTLTLVDQRTTSLPLEGTLWTVDGLVAGDAVSSVPQGVTATLVFAGGLVSVNAGCNSGSGSAAVGDAKITFGPILLTKMACGSGAMAVELRVTSVLRGTQPYSIAGDSLILGESGKDGLTLKGAAVAPSTPPGPS